MREICTEDLFDYIPIGSHIINNHGWTRKVVKRTIARVFFSGNTYRDEVVLITEFLSGPCCGATDILTRESFHDTNWHIKN